MPYRSELTGLSQVIKKCWDGVMRLQLGEHRQLKTVDLSASPKAGQVAAPTMLGLYQLDDDTVTIGLSAIVLRSQPGSNGRVR